MAKTFSPKKYINGEINSSNCNHEVVLHDVYDEGENLCKHYHCMICGKIIQHSLYDLNFENERSVYQTTDLNKHDEDFIKNIITYLAHRYSEEKNIDLVSFFNEHHSNISSMLDYINTPTKKDKKKVLEKYNKLFKEDQ